MTRENGMSSILRADPGVAVLAIDSKKYRRRGVWTMVGEVVSLKPVAVIEGVPGHLLTDFLRRYDLNCSADLLGVVIDGSDALRRLLEGGYARRNRSLLIAADPYHLVKGSNQPLLDRAREVLWEFVDNGGCASRKLSSRAMLLLPQLDDLHPVTQRPLVDEMLGADPLLAELHAYIKPFADLLADGCAREVLRWADAPPPRCEWRTRTFRNEVRSRIGQIAALIELRRLTGRLISTGQVEALQAGMARELVLRGGRSSIRQGMGALMARRTWTDELIASVVDSLF